MIKKVTVDKARDLKLERQHSKLGECITWRMMHGRYIIAFIAQYNNPYVYKKVGWQQFPNKFWIGYKVNGDVIVAKTRGEIINVIKENYHAD